MYWSILFFYIHYYWEFNHIKQVLLCLKLCFYESLLSGSYSNITVSGVALQIRLHGNMKCIMSSLKVFLAYLKCLQIIWGDRNIFNCTMYHWIIAMLQYHSFNRALDYCIQVFCCHPQHPLCTHSTLDRYQCSSQGVCT